MPSKAPKDIKGRKLKVGDRVEVPCIVTQINPPEDVDPDGDEGWVTNLEVKTVYAVPGTTQQKHLALGSTQVKKSPATKKRP